MTAVENTGADIGVRPGAGGGWHRVADTDVPADGRVRTAVVDGRPVALSRCGGRLGALENRCPHQGGPLGEGSIETGGCAARGTGTTTTR